jgi:HD-GYP domain-containing protein (c-di-GMP phosphodiesterase class II)
MSVHQIPALTLPRKSGWAPESLRIKQLEGQVSLLRNSVICALNQTLDLKDLNTGVHSTRLAEWSMRIAQELGFEPEDLPDVEVAALMHDVGKIGVPDAILNKPERLTEEEYAVIKKHPEYSWTILRLLPGFERASLFALHHHERFDGTGYPARLANSEIPIGSRIVSVIDAFDAMISSRPYRQGLPFDEGVRRLLASSGTQFDPQVVHCFIPIAEAEVDSVFAAAGTGIGAAL